LINVSVDSFNNVSYEIIHAIILYIKTMLYQSSVVSRIIFTLNNIMFIQIR